MRLLYIIIISQFIHLYSFGQSIIDDGQEIKSAILKDVDRKLPQMKKMLESQGLNASEIEFSLDTIRVDLFTAKYLERDNSTIGMLNAYGETQALYDSLLNKYYKRLFSKLSTNDRPVLVAAQRNWIQYRDAEYKLIGLLEKEDYSGSGTVQGLISSSSILDLTKGRTVEIFNHLLRMESN